MKGLSLSYATTPSYEDFDCSTRVVLGIVSNVSIYSLVKIDHAHLANIVFKDFCWHNPPLLVRVRRRCLMRTCQPENSGRTELDSDYKL